MLINVDGFMIFCPVYKEEQVPWLPVEQFASQGPVVQN